MGRGGNQLGGENPISLTVHPWPFVADSPHLADHCRQSTAPDHNARRSTAQRRPLTVQTALCRPPGRFRPPAAERPSLSRQHPLVERSFVKVSCWIVFVRRQTSVSSRIAPPRAGLSLWAAGGRADGRKRAYGRERAIKRTDGQAGALPDRQAGGESGDVTARRAGRRSLCRRRRDGIHAGGPWLRCDVDGRAPSFRRRTRWWIGRWRWGDAIVGGTVGERATD